MPRIILKYRELACVWSTIVDAPVTNFEPYEALRERFPDHRVEDLLTSDVGVFNHNRAGPGESRVTNIETLLELYKDDGQG